MSNQLETASPSRSSARSPVFRWQRVGRPGGGELQERPSYGHLVAFVRARLAEHGIGTGRVDVIPHDHECEPLPAMDEASNVVAYVELGTSCPRLTAWPADCEASRPRAWHRVEIVRIVDGRVRPLAWIRVGLADYEALYLCAAIVGRALHRPMNPFGSRQDGYEWQGQTTWHTEQGRRQEQRALWQAHPSERPAPPIVG